MSGCGWIKGAVKIRDFNGPGLPVIALRMFVGVMSGVYSPVIKLAPD